MQEHRNRDVVGQVRNHRRRRRSGQRGDGQRVGRNDLQPVARRPHVSRDGCRQGGCEHGVDLDRHDSCPRGQQTERQRTQPRADLEDDIAPAHVSDSDDPAHGVGVHDEVLPELLGG